MRASGRSSPSIVALAIVAGVAAVALVAVLPGCGVARAEPYAKPWLFNGAIGFGIEPQRRVKADCELAQCGQLVAFSLAAEVLWRGLLRRP